MTISTEAAALSYAGDDSINPLSITWKYFAKSHVVATLRVSDGTETTWVLDTDYTLTDAGVDAGGTLTPIVAPATGETTVITLEPPNTQLTDIPLGGSFPASSVEDGLDQAAQRDSKLEDFQDRTLRVPKTDTQSGSDLELPIDSDRASKFLAFDASGKAIASSGTVDGTVPVSTFMETVLDDTTAPIARTTLGAVGLTGNETVAGVKTFSGNNLHTGTNAFTGDQTINSGSLKIGSSGEGILTSDGTTGMTITTAGEFNYPTQPAFQVIPASNQVDIPINATTTIVFGTERFDIGGNFASNTFTAPVTGKYHLEVSLDLVLMDIDNDSYTLNLVTSNKTYVNYYRVDVEISGDQRGNMSLSVLADMDASDTATISFTIPNAGANQVDVSTASYFSGYLAT